MTTFETYVAELRDLHRRAGEPSTRDIAARCTQKVSHTTVADLLNGRRLPLRTTVDLVVAALAELTGESTEVVVGRFHDLWEAAYNELASPSRAAPDLVLEELRGIRAVLDRIAGAVVVDRT